MRAIVVCTTVMLAVLAAPAMADMTVPTAQIRVTDGPGSGNGGAYTIEILSGSLPSMGLEVGDTFLTFCVEMNESLNPGGSTYYVTVNDYATGGGLGGAVLGKDPLAVATEKLYSQWLALVSTDSSNATANMYQVAIWAVEQEVVWDPLVGPSGQYVMNNASHTQLDPVYQGFDQATIQGLIDAATGSTGVQVMNLWTGVDSYGNGTGAAQDLLVVPLPGAVLLGFLGLGAAGLKLRKYV